VHAFIIEDDYLISQTIQEILTDLGFTAFSFARSEDAAVAGATGETFDLITADSRLLPGDGVRAVEAICSKKQMPVIFITGYRSHVEARLPHAIVIEKPIKPEELIAAVRSVLGKASAPPPGQD